MERGVRGKGEGEEAVWGTGRVRGKVRVGTVFQIPEISSFQFQIKHNKISDFQIAMEAINTTTISGQRR